MQLALRMMSETTRGNDAQDADGADLQTTTNTTEWQDNADITGFPLWKSTSWLYVKRTARRPTTLAITRRAQKMSCGAHARRPCGSRTSHERHDEWCEKYCVVERYNEWYEKYCVVVRTPLEAASRCKANCAQADRSSS